MGRKIRALTPVSGEITTTFDSTPVWGSTVGGAKTEGMNLRTRPSLCWKGSVPGSRGAAVAIFDFLTLCLQ